MDIVEVSAVQLLEFEEPRRYLFISSTLDDRPTTQPIFQFLQLALTTGYMDWRALFNEYFMENDIVSGLLKRMSRSKVVQIFIVYFPIVVDYAIEPRLVVILDYH